MNRALAFALCLPALTSCQRISEVLVRGPTIRARTEALEPDRRVWSFRHMSELFPTRTISRGGAAHELERAERDLGALSFELDGRRVDFEAFFERNGTQGMVVLHGGRLVFERYAPGADEATRFTSWSVAKSVTSTLVGLALAEGRIASVRDPLVRYIPELEGTAYDGVTVKQALQMSSGVEFSEVYEEDGSDVYEFMVSSMFTNRERANDAAIRYPRRAAPGTVFNYNTAETQVLGWLVRNATGRSLSDYLEEKIWRLLGMEHDATWILDREGADGMEMAGCCLNAALRDWARLGQLMLEDGLWRGSRILPRGWVAEATVPDSPQLAFGRADPPSTSGYQYQWWARPDGAFAAEGVYGQFIYVSPARGVVIAKASVWPEAWDFALEREAFAAFEAVAAALAAPSPGG
jgi:hypothetical protein